jgi:hypothetical protein
MTAVIYNAPMRHFAHRLAARAGIVMLVSAALMQVGCGGNEPDVKTALQIVDVVSGWFDAGIVNGQNKLVPTLSFRGKNSADRPVTYVSFNVGFKVVGDTQVLGSSFLRGIDSLPAGQTSTDFVGRSDLGYTSPEPRAQMLQHSQFKDVEAEVFAKHASEQFVSLGKYTIKRQLITQ